MTVFKDVSDTARVQPDLADDRPAEAQAFISPALPGESIVEGWVTSYEVVDKVGDIGTFGMFSATLAKFRATGKRIPVTDSHDWTSKGIIGYALPTEVVEVRKGGPGGKGGLFARMHLLTEDSKTAAFLYKLMQELPLQMSYAFDSVSERPEKTGTNKKANRLLAVQLLELTVCLFGAVEQTSVRARKQREAIMRTSEYKAWDKKRREVDSLVLSAELLTQERPHRAGERRGSVSAGGSGYDAVADFEAFALGYENDENPVRKFDRVVRQVYAKDVAGLGATRCRCGSYITNKVQPPVTGGTISWQACENCGTLRSFVPKSMSDRDADREMRIIRSKVRVVPDTRATDAEHNAKMLASLKKAEQRREVADLVAFSSTPARSSRESVKDMLDSFDAVLSKKPPTNPLDGLKMPGGRGEPHV